MAKQLNFADNGFLTGFQGQGLGFRLAGYAPRVAHHPYFKSTATGMYKTLG
jgi:hypothetical protein